MWELCQDDLSCLFNSNTIYMQYDARRKEANDESALLTTSSMQISGAYCHNYGNMRTMSTMPCLSSSSCHLQIQVACDVYNYCVQDF